MGRRFVRKMIKIHSADHSADSGFGNKLFLSCFAECYAIETKQKLFNWLVTDILHGGSHRDGISKKDNVNVEWKHLDVDIDAQEQFSVVGVNTTLSTNSFHQSPDDIALMKKYKNLVVQDFGRREGVFVHVRSLDRNRSPGVEYYKSCLRDSSFGYVSSDSPESDTVKYLLDNFNLKLYQETPEKTIIFASMFEHKVLSLGTFSWWIGFIGNQNNVMCPYPKDYQIWHGEIFEPMTEWNMIRKPFMKKIISFSLYGNKSNFQVGAAVNVLEAKRLYPDWKCRFYTTDDEGICKQLEYLGAEIVRMDDHWMNQGHYYGSLWRFLAVDDADVCIFRDADSVVNERELGAVNEWLATDKQWHIMHDHRLHKGSKIMAGMFGYRACEQDAHGGKHIFDFKNKDSMLELIKGWLNGSTNKSRSFDQDFLGDIIRPQIDGSFLSHGYYGKDFPNHSPCRYGNFVGDYSFWAGGWNGFVDGDRDLFVEYKTKEALDSGLLPEAVCVYHNLGLGDHILMNGPIRHAIHNYNIKELRLICKESNYNSVAYMYRDEPKIKVMSICHKSKLKDEQKAAKWRKEEEDRKTGVVSVMMHHHGSRFPNTKECPFCNCNSNTIPFSTTGGTDLILCPEDTIYDNFYIQRDDKTESDKMEKILSENGLDAGDKYAFVCVSCSVGTDPKLLEEIKASTGIPLIIAKQSVEYKGGDCSTPVDYNGVIFEWMKIIEEASEIHTIDTSFFHLINGMNLKNVGKFFWKSFGRKFLDHWKKDGWEVRD